jgi:hypothetical protein
LRGLGKSGCSNGQATFVKQPGGPVRPQVTAVRRKATADPGKHTIDNFDAYVVHDSLMEMP